MKVCIAGLLVLGLAAIVLPQAAQADWDPGMPKKWVQLPDLRVNPTGGAPYGIDVNATDIQPPGPGLEGPARVLADDFECKTTEYITDIHIWGSWKGDILPTGGPNNVTFRLSIHADVPAGQIDPQNPQNPPTEWSRPGALLWENTFTPSPLSVRRYGPATQEGWYDPLTGLYDQVGDTQCWQYNFFIPEAEAFKQLGTSDKSIIYWLDVDALVPKAPQGTPQPEFGWKTSIDHWNDDAAWREDGMLPGMWNELRYPNGHPLQGQSIDMAFVITPEPATMCLLGLGVAGILARRRRN